MAQTSPFLKAAVQHPLPPERINLEASQQNRFNGSANTGQGFQLPGSPAPAIVLSTGDRKPSVPSALPPVVVPHGRSRMPSVIKEAMRFAGNRRHVSIEPNVLKEFGCGDKYQGSWQAGLPHGHGTYTWADSSMYQGDWEVMCFFIDVYQTKLALCSDHMQHPRDQLLSSCHAVVHF